MTNNIAIAIESRIKELNWHECIIMVHFFMLENSLDVNGPVRFSRYSFSRVRTEAKT